jgi:hypothetical protein
MVLETVRNRDNIHGLVSSIAPYLQQRREQ